jgi:hypothetical protein
MRCHATKLDAELRANGIPIHGCNSDGIIWLKDEATAAHRATAARVLATHDYDACCAAESVAKERAAKIDAEMRAMAEERLVARGEL